MCLYTILIHVLKLDSLAGWPDKWSNWIWQISLFIRIWRSLFNYWGCLHSLICQDYGLSFISKICFFLISGFGYFEIWNMLIILHVSNFKSYCFNGSATMKMKCRYFTCKTVNFHFGSTRMKMKIDCFTFSFIVFQNKTIDTSVSLALRGWDRYF